MLEFNYLGMIRGKKNISISDVQKLKTTMKIVNNDVVVKLFKYAAVKSA